MRIPAWIIAAICLAVPAATMAAEGNPAAGKAKAEELGCSGCHGADGVATEDGLAVDKNMPNLAAEPDLYTQFQLVFFRKGVRKNELMSPIAESLSDADIRNLGAFYASLPVPRAERHTPARRKPGRFSGSGISAIKPDRHCERSEAIHAATQRKNGLLRRFAPCNDETMRTTA